jgi:alpha-glucosidase
LADRVTPAQLRTAATLLMTLRGTPIVFYGDELGLHNQDVPRDRQRDYFGLTDRGVSRDPIRTPMPWNSAANAGFSTAPPEQLWLPISHRAAEVNVSVQRADPDSLLNLYRALTRLRAGSPALRQGAFRLAPEVAAPASGCLAYRRQAGGDHKLVVLNLTRESRTVTMRDSPELVFSTHPHRNIRSQRSEFALIGGEGVILSAQP